MRAHRRLAVAVVLALAVAACGSNLDEATLRDAQGLFAEDQVGRVSSSLEPGEEGALGEVTDGGTGAGTTAGGSATGGTARSGSGSGGGGGGGEIVLGSFGTYSGLVGAQVAAMPVAVRAWAADVNARGGINGRSVRVVFGDDGGDPGQALAVARRMVEQDKVVAFVGAASPLSMQSVTPYLEEKQVPVIGTSGGNLADDSSMVFSTLAAADLGAGRSAFLALTTQSPARNVALVYCLEAASCPNQARRLREYAAAAGVNIVYETQVSIASPDYTVEMLQARSRGADAIAVVMDYSSIVRMLRSAHRQNWNPVVASTGSVNEEAFLKSAGADAEGVLSVSNGSVPYSTSPLMAPYRDAVRRYVPGGSVGGTGAGAWIGAILLEKVLRGIEGTPTTAAILEGLYALRGETLGGIVPPITFPKGPHTRVNLCSVPIKVVDGKFVASRGETFFCTEDAGIVPR